MNALSNQDALVGFMKKIAEGEAERGTPPPLQFHILDENGKLTKLSASVLFVQTGPDAGFVVYKGIPAENECLMFSYPGFKGSEHCSRFVTKACCSNMIGMQIEVEETQKIPEQDIGR